MNRQKVLFYAAFFAAVVASLVLGQGDTEGPAQNQTESPAEVLAAEAAANSDQGSAASQESWKPGGCWHNYDPVCCDRYEHHQHFVSFVHNWCYCKSIGGSTVSDHTCYNRCGCPYHHRPVCCYRHGKAWWAKNSCQCRCKKGHVVHPHHCVK
jgi:hypothetical protein